MAQRIMRTHKLEAVRLIRDRGVSADHPKHVFPGHGKMKPEQLEIARLKREVIRLKAKWDILKKPRPALRRNRREVVLHCQAPENLAGV